MLIQEFMTFVLEIFKIMLATQKNQNTNLKDIRPSTVPGYFTGIYTSPSNSFAISQSGKVSKTAFAQMLEKVTGENENDLAPKDLYVNAKVQPSSSGLPFISSLLEEVGTYGFIFARGLHLCQYYKKVSPPPRFF